MALVVRVEDLLPGWQFSLNCLVPNQALYSATFFQCSGAIEATGKFIRNQNRDQSYQKHFTFLESASRDATNLVVTPEYSTPWRIIEKICEGAFGPAAGNIWILGMESISPAELQEFKNSNAGIEWIFEEPAPANTQQVFLDPTCLIFPAHNPDGESRLVVLVQFKCEPMRDGIEHLERRHLIKGTRTYRIRNDENSIRLITLICADAFNFNFHDDLRNIDPHQNVGWLFVHVQLIPEPYHEQYKEYRSRFFRDYVRDDVEFLCVNWARGFSIAGHGGESSFGGSVHYFRSQKPDLTDARLNGNHRNGVYFAYMQKQKVMANVFNYAEHCFKFQLSKVKILQGPAAGQSDRTGLEATGCFEHTAQGWIAVEPKDGFQEMCILHEISPEAFLRTTLSPMDKERLGSLTLALVDTDSIADPRNLVLLSLTGSNEALERLTVVQQPNQPGYDSNFTKRIGRLQDAHELEEEILTNQQNLPDILKEFFGVSELHFENSKGNTNFNLYSLDRKKKALVAYIGNTSVPIAEQVLDRLENLFDGAFARVVVWFKKGGGVLTYTYSEFVPKVDSEFSRSKKRITKETV